MLALCTLLPPVYIYYFDSELIMKQYTQYIKNQVIVISIFSLAGITIIGGFLNLGNTLGYWLLLIGSTIVIGYFYLRYNYQSKINRLDPGVLDSLK